MLEKGQKAPNFKTQINSGEEFELNKVDSKFIILYFYPKDDTSGCTQQACDIRDNMDVLTKFDAKIFGISKDKLKSHQKFIDKYNLNFPLLLDENKDICNLYGVMKEKSMYGRKYIGIDRTTFILDKDLNILEVINNVNPKTHIKDLVEVLENLTI